MVLPKRWIVERTFAWLMRYRRLGSECEYETTVASSVGWIYAAMIHRMVRRLAPVQIRRHPYGQGGERKLLDRASSTF